MLALEVRRLAGVRALALAIDADMTLVACAALTIGGLVFLQRKPAKSTLMGALGGMLFALPGHALRHARGASARGARGPAGVLLWAELAVTLALLLLIAMWAQPAARK